MLGISRSYLSEIESGKKVASIDLLEKYAEIFEIPPSSLLLFSENIEKGIPSEKARVMFAKKIIKIMNWLSDTEDTKGGKYNKPA
jgi:transcriptional regulator with XRE-family HTH domain